jgi:hypothetical protein
MQAPYRWRRRASARRWNQQASGRESCRRRDYIFRLLQEGQITDEARRRIERELDLEEASLAFNRKGETDPPL